MRNPAEYREHRAAVRRLHVAVIEAVDAQHRSLVTGDLARAEMLTDDLSALAGSLAVHLRWLVNYVSNMQAGVVASERSAH